MVISILVGIETYPEFAKNPILAIITVVIQIIFTVDVVLKIVQEGRYPLKYWYPMCHKDTSIHLHDSFFHLIGSASSACGTTSTFVS